MTSFFEEFLLMYSMLIADLQLIKNVQCLNQHKRDPGGPMINERNSRVACSNPNILYTQHFCGKKLSRMVSTLKLISCHTRCYNGCFAILLSRTYYYSLPVLPRVEEVRNRNPASHLLAEPLKNQVMSIVSQFWLEFKFSRFSAVRLLKHCYLLVQENGHCHLHPNWNPGGNRMVC